jgi:hypothetical protein
MGITVKDVLSLDLLENAVVVTGESGLNREVLRVNFTDCPVDEEDPGYSLVTKGDLYIHSFYIDYQDEKRIYDIINFYILTGSSCCIALDYYLKEIPTSVKKLANEYSYPIIMINSDVPYAALIQNITELIMTEQLTLHSEIKLNRLMYDNLSVKDTQEILNYLIPRQPENFVCLFVNFITLSPINFHQLKNELSLQFNLRFLRYQDGGFLIFNLDIYKNFNKILPTLLHIFSRLETPFYIGISSFFESSDYLPHGFREALDASQIGLMTERQITRYEEVSLFNLLLALKNHETLNKFCCNILQPLRDYEKNYSINLIETISVYLELNGDIAKSATRLNTHENTVRFRIRKARSLLGLENKPYVFIEQVSIALKGDLILKSRKSKEDYTSYGQR